MRSSSKTAPWVLVAPLVLFALPLLTGDRYLYKALRATYLQGHATANIDDAAVFDQRLVRAGASRPWPRSESFDRAPLSPGLEAHLRDCDTAAWLVVRNGEVLQERYFPPYTAESRTNSFSVAKTVTTMLVGAAIADGHVRSFDQPVADFIPELARDPRGRKATLAQLSAMSAGNDWTESYHLPLNPTTELYYGDDVARVVLSRGFEREPGTAFEYSSASTQILGIALQRALRERTPGLTLSDYLSRKLWTPLGMERDGLWALDRADGGIEKTFCCIFATARDLARFGELLLRRGQWEGRTLLDSAFVDRMTKPDLEPFYGHSLWMDWEHKEPFFLLEGHLGQYVIVVPRRELVIVRLGRTRDREEEDEVLPHEVYRYVDEAVRAAAL